MKHFTAVIERDTDTGVYVGWVPGFPGAHSQGDTLDELRANLHEVVEMLLEDGDPRYGKSRKTSGSWSKTSWMGNRP